MGMEPTRFYTISLPQANANNAPAVITTATQVPLRVLVRNRGPVPCFIAGSSSDLQVAGGAVSAVYTIPSGLTDTFVIAPRQTLYAAGVGAGGEICVSISEAYPAEVT